MSEKTSGGDSTKSKTSSVIGPEPEKYRSEFRLALRALRRDKLALAGVVIVLIVVVISIAAPLISPYDPNVADPEFKRLSPVGSPGHLLGTDTQGRDILSRLIWGGRVSIPIAIAPIFVATVTSLILGLIAGYFGGVIAELVMRPLDVLFAFPMVLLAVSVASIMGPGMMNVMLSMGIVLIPFFTRVVYVEVMAVRRMEFIEAARSCGTGRARLLFREILPNILAPVLVYATTSIGGMIVFAAGFSFLGLGVQPPTADWGIMCANGRLVLLEAPHLATIPGLVIVIVTLAFNVAGDGIRDVLDPRQRRAVR